MKTPDATSLGPAAPSHSLDAQLRFAIAHKRLIQFSYDGRDRLAEPHDYGVQKGTTKVLIYQLRKAGGSSRDAIGWRLLDTSKILDCEILERRFGGTRARSDQRHHTWDLLYARVT